MNYLKAFRKTALLFPPLAIILIFTNCSSKKVKNNCQPSQSIFVNQVAYTTSAIKKAFVKDYDGPVKIFDSNNDLILELNTSPKGEWAHSGEIYSSIDFTEIVKEGTYSLELGDGQCAYPIIILDTFPLDLCKQAMQSKFYNRASMPITEEFGGIWARPLAHPDDSILIHETAADNGHKPGDVVSSPGGWYDAGDYNKYIVNSSITVHTLLSAFERYPGIFQSMELNIPEKNNSIPDMIDETLYNLRWMLTMQDSDGGVYHKLSTKTFQEFVMPNELNKPRYMLMKTTTATLDFAATMAKAARVLSNIAPLEKLVDSCKLAAENAWNWSVKNPGVFYKQPIGMNTGEYNDTNMADEWMWASVELFLTSEKQSYLDEERVFNIGFPFTTPSWDVVNTLGLMGIVTNKERFADEFYQKALKTYLATVDKLYDIYKTSPALTSLDYFKWGSNSDVANQSMLAFLAYELTKDKKYYELATNNMDYLLGRNPTGYCFVTGFGKKTPEYLHHRLTASDGVAEIYPGMLVGGPNTVVPSDCDIDSTVTRHKKPALSYADAICSYSTNEMAINWTAPMVYISAAMHYHTLK